MHLSAPLLNNMTLASSAAYYSLKLIKLLVYTSATIVAGVSVLAFFFQNRLLYINYGLPNPMIPGGTPERYGMTYQDVWIATEDQERLHAWFMYHRRQGVSSADVNTTTASESEQPPSDTNKPLESLPSKPISHYTNKLSSNTVLVYLHGNAGDVSGRMRNLVELYNEIPSLDGILIVDYRGYGKSTGTPTEKGLMLDAKATLNYAKHVLKADNVIVFGRSLGGAVSVSLMEKQETASLVDMLILENTFTSVPTMIPHVFPKWLSWASFFCWHRWESIRVIDRINIPILFISGLKDEIVPSIMMKQLYEKCKSPHKRLETFEHGKHNETFVAHREEYYSKMGRFIEEYL